MSATLQTQKTTTSAKPSLTPSRFGVIQRKCDCGGSAGISGKCEECQEKQLTMNRYSTDRRAPSGLLSSRAEPARSTSLSDSGASVQAGAGRPFGRLHVGAVAPIGTGGERAVSQPGDRSEDEADRVAAQVMRVLSSPVLEGKQEAPEVMDLSQTPPLIQREVADENAPEMEAGTEPATGPETAAPEETPAPGLIVEDNAREVGPGQMRKSDFLDQLRAAICATADAELAAVERSTTGCPYIEQWIGYYRRQSGQRIERAIHRYAAGVAGVASAQGYIPLISERVRSAVAVWAKTGEITGVPEGASAAPPATGASEEGETTSAATGQVQFKDGAGGAKSADNPAAVRAQLDGGRPIDTDVRSRMESAFGHDFSRVRIHTDPKAAGITSGLNARAFTIGSDVAFASGEYKPGTLIGDALIAHELAHVVQQGGGSDSVMPAQTGDANYNTLERDADESAISAVVSLWGGAKGAAAKIARNATPGLKSGLRLQRCTAGGVLTEVVAPSDFVFNTVIPKSGSGPGGWKVACFEPQFTAYLDPASPAVKWRLECQFEVGVPVENYLGPVSDILAQQEAAISGNLAAQAVFVEAAKLPARPPKGIFCLAYKKAMEAAFVVAVPGAKVGSFGKYCK